MESKGAWTTELGNEQTEEVEEYHLDVRYNVDTNELIDVKVRMEQSIDTNLFVMGQAEQFINQLEAEKTIFTADERNLIVNYAYKLDDMDKTRELAEKLAFMEKTMIQEKQIQEILTELSKIENTSSDKKIAKILNHISKELSCLV